MEFQSHLNKAKMFTRSAGNLYLKHRERIDTAFIGHAVTATALNATASKIAISVIAVKLAPFAAAAAGAYYGPEICRRARDFLASSDLRSKPMLLSPIRINSNPIQNPIKPK